MALFRRIEALGLRRFAATHLLAFLLAVAVAPHQHANSLEDLLSDGPSDSGIFVDGGQSPDPTGEPQWHAARLIDDDPCLACFHHDFSSIAEVTAFVTVISNPLPIDSAFTSNSSAAPPTSPPSRDSRAPPALV
jgi:hypothetical protein